MKALILNSGAGRRIGSSSDGYPKCMTRLMTGETIISRQLRILEGAGIKEAVITTGLFADKLQAYVEGLETNIKMTYVHNPLFDKTNYIYSIYLARNKLDDNILLLHGDLVFDCETANKLLGAVSSAVIISRSTKLPDKDFKAEIYENKIKKIGIDIFENAVALQPFYKINRETWGIWLNEICSFCERGEHSCYAENAFNAVSDKCIINGLDIQNLLCGEIDSKDDLRIMNERLKGGEHK